jgi:hypothetical protein
MEAFGILCSIPVAFVVSAVYCAILAAAIRRYESLRGPLYTASLLVLFVLVCELVLLATRGAVDSRALVGPAFYAGHVVCFILGSIFAFCLVLLQYAVFEALYGVDGTNGPCS